MRVFGRRPLVASACAACAVLVAIAAAGAGSDAAAPRRGLIVYWSDSPWPSIWSIRPDGTHRRRILRNRRNAKRPRLSPDRKWVAFDGTPAGKPLMSDFDVQLVRIGGTGRRTLTGAEAWDLDAQWSPDGSRLAFARMPPGPEWEQAWTWTIRPDGSDLRRIARGQQARWSPDGTKLVLSTPTESSQGDLYVVAADGGDRRLLLAGPQLDAPAGWSPDGRTILFTRYRTGDRADVFVVAADGTGLRRLARGIAAAWSPDSSRILYTSSSQLLVMGADGSDKHRISRVRALEPDWR